MPVLQYPNDTDAGKAVVRSDGKIPEDFTVTLSSLLVITPIWLYISVLILKVTDDGKIHDFFLECMYGIN